MVFDEKVFNQRVGKAVLEHISSLLGPTSVKVINLYLKRYDTDLRLICEDPQKVSDALHIIFEGGAAFLEKEIARAAYEIFNLTPSEFDSLRDAIGRLRNLAEGE